MGRARGGVHLTTPERRPRYRESAKWTDERLQGRLLEATAGFEQWPTRRQFGEAGYSELPLAVSHHGGAAYWAARLRLPLPGGRDRLTLSDEEAVVAAREVIAAMGRLPRHEVLANLGYPKLATAVINAGGSVAFCAAHNLPNPPGRGRRRLP